MNFTHFLKIFPVTNNHLVDGVDFIIGNHIYIALNIHIDNDLNLNKSLLVEALNVEVVE
jgi:hypothetical protein